MTLTLEEKQFVDGIKINDHELIGKFIKAHQNFIFRICYSLSHDKAEAEDITQEVFIKVINSIGQFKEASGLKTWIYRIAVNKTINFLNSKKRFSWFERLENVIVSKESILINSDIDIIEDEREETITSQIIFKALDKLPVNQKVAFTLHNLDDLSYLEISETMQLSISAVESLIHRAKQNLQKILMSEFKKNKIDRKFYPKIMSKKQYEL